MRSESSSNFNQANRDPISSSLFLYNVSWTSWVFLFVLQCKLNEPSIFVCSTECLIGFKNGQNLFGSVTNRQMSFNQKCELVLWLNCLSVQEWATKYGSWMSFKIGNSKKRREKKKKSKSNLNYVPVFVWLCTWINLTCFEEKILGTRVWLCFEEKILGAERVRVHVVLNINLSYPKGWKSR